MGLLSSHDAKLAYQDVAAAFRYWREHYNRGRPFILAAHSQGTVHARRLLREAVSGTPLRHQLVAAYLVGIPLSEEALRRTLPDLPVCGSPEQTGCLISWNARSAGYTERLPVRDSERHTGARCGDGMLEVHIGEELPRDFMSRLLDHTMGEGNHHPVEYQLFYMNLRRNAAERVAAFLRTNTTANTRRQ